MRPELLYRADHVGSLLRPPDLLQARVDQGVTLEERHELEDRHIERILQRQRDIGLQIFTDGELRRAGFMSDFYDSVEGLDTDGTVARAWQSATGTAIEGNHPLARLTGSVIAPIRQTKRLTRHETEFLRLHSPGDIKMTLPSANQFPALAYKKGLSERAYPTYSEFLWDVVPIIRSEIAALVDDGVDYIQIDAPRYSYFIDEKWRQYVRGEMGVDPDAALDEAIRADNACFAAAAGAGIVRGIHLCRGNNRSQWYAEGGYDPIAERLFAGLDADVFLLEYDSDRAGTFEPLRFVPKDKAVVLGLVSTKVPELETRDQLLHRIEEASRYVPIENLALSPQCGFASTFEGNRLTEDDQWRKLELVVATARQVWPSSSQPRPTPGV
jgi:5-methyltetrahydropteroyltriglutamate--homocysteine methyltransferase